VRAALLATLIGAGLAAGLPPEPAAVSSAAAALASATPHYTWQIAGHSGQGRPIGLLLVTARPAALAEQLRVMIIARQHGDEASPAAATLLWLRANAATPSRFRNVAVLWVPTLNPDGAVAGTRVNGAGVDLNRDWMALTQPETRLAERLIRRWQPHVLVDLHEFDGVRHGRRVDPDWIETLQTGRLAQDQTSGWLLREVVAAQRQVGEQVQSLLVQPGATAPTLCHRAMALRHRLPAVLVEVGDRRADPGARVVDELVTLLDSRYETLKPRLDDLRRISGWTPPDGWPPELAPVTAPQPAPRRPTRPPASPWPVAIGFAAILWSTTKFSIESVDR